MAPLGIVTVTGPATRGWSPAAGSARVVRRASTGTVPAAASTATLRSTDVIPSFAATRTACEEVTGSEYRPASSVVVWTVPVPPLTSVTLAAWSGRPVASSRTCPTTTPEPVTFVLRDAVPTLPAASVASAETTRVSPGFAVSGTDSVAV